MELTPSRKGAIAEAAIVKACIDLGLEVLRPFGEGRRYDLVIDNGAQLLRAQVKWAVRRGAVIHADLGTSRYTPNGYVTTTYRPEEIDGFALHCQETAQSFWLPIGEFSGRQAVHLRLEPAANGQRGSIRWAAEYPFGAVAQLARASRWQREGQGFESPQLHSMRRWLSRADGALGRLAPQLLEAVVLARLRGEEVDDDVQVVHEDPAGLGEALHAAG